jgi:hypothetical protein
MRVEQTAFSRLAPYDRNAQVIMLQYASGPQSPHTETERLVYTVPAGKKAFLDVIYMEVYRRDIPTKNGMAVMYLYFSPNGVDWFRLMGAKVQSSLKNDTSFVRVTNAAMLYPGNKLKVTTADDSEGGNCVFIINLKLTLFDA